jgi:hypothetical protein
MGARYNDDGPRVPERQTPTRNDSTPHDIAMFGMAWRIRWLERNRHWWIRSIKGRWT